MAAGSGFPTDMLDLVDIEATEVQRGVVACALYRDGWRERDVAVDKIGALAGRDGGINWLGLHEPDAVLLSVLKAKLGLHELMIEDANQAHHAASRMSMTTCCSPCCERAN
jgi:Mg2+ and Co2+ transporter CorA